MVQELRSVSPMLSSVSAQFARHCHIKSAPIKIISRMGKPVIILQAEKCPTEILFLIPSSYELQSMFKHDLIVLCFFLQFSSRQGLPTKSCTFSPPQLTVSKARMRQSIGTSAWSDERAARSSHYRWPSRKQVCNSRYSRQLGVPKVPLSLPTAFSTSLRSIQPDCL